MENILIPFKSFEIVYRDQYTGRIEFETVFTHKDALAFADNIAGFRVIIGRTANNEKVQLRSWKDSRTTKGNNNG